MGSKQQFVDFEFNISKQNYTQIIKLEINKQTQQNDRIFITYYNVEEEYTLKSS